MTLELESERKRFEEQAEQAAKNIVAMNALALLENTDPEPGSEEAKARELCELQTKAELEEFTRAMREDIEKLMRKVGEKDHALHLALRDLRAFYADDGRNLAPGAVLQTIEAIKRVVDG